MIIKFIILLFLSSPAFAGGFIGVSVNHLKINDGYKYESNYQPSFNFGYNLILDNWVLSASTNRFLNQSVERKATKNNITYNSKSKLLADTFSIGYRINRFVISPFLVNATVDKSLYYNDRKLGSTHTTSILSGLNLTYFIDKNISISSAYVAPNQEQSLESGLVLGINYNF